MNQQTRPLYGELVPSYGELAINASGENQTNVQDEENALKEQDQLMIREAAYYLAEKRGFAPGHELEDWLEAEKQVMK